MYVLYRCQLFVLSIIPGFPTLLRAYGTAWLNRAASCRCKSIPYGRATQTSITVVSKFPQKLGEPRMREQWIPGALLPNYQERLGTRLNGYGHCCGYQLGVQPGMHNVERAERAEGVCNKPYSVWTRLGTSLPPRAKGPIPIRVSYVICTEMVTNRTDPAQVTTPEL